MVKRRMLDLFCGRFGWGRAFAARGWEVVGIDLVEPPEIQTGCTFVQADILAMNEPRRFDGKVYCSTCQGSGNFYGPFDEDNDYLPCDDCSGHGFNIRTFGSFDFICASSPCEQFSVHGMKHFHPNPPYPELGIRLFNHTRLLCEASGLPYVMENVRAAQQFVGNAVNHCGPFYLWGNAVPPLMNQGIKKGMSLATGYAGFAGKFILLTKEQKRAARKADPMLWASSRSPERKAATAAAATIPPELASCVADYAERITECVA